eukprot:5920789-Lingulodinium_polyedra.AAC.1
MGPRARNSCPPLRPDGACAPSRGFGLPASNNVPVGKVPVPLRPRARVAPRSLCRAGPSRRFAGAGG